MSNEANLAFKDNGWWTCGCGGIPKVRVQTPANSRAVYIASAQTLNGPTTGIEYTFQPHQNSIDIDNEDAKIWLSTGVARPPLTGYKGRFTRTGNVDVSKQK